MTEPAASGEQSKVAVELETLTRIVKAQQQILETHQKLVRRGRFWAVVLGSLGVTLGAGLGFVYNTARSASELAGRAEKSLDASIAAIREEAAASVRAISQEGNGQLSKLKEAVPQIIRDARTAADSQPRLIGADTMGRWPDYITREKTHGRAIVPVRKGDIVQVDVTASARSSLFYYRVTLRNGNALTISNPVQVLMNNQREWRSMTTTAVFKASEDGTLAFGVELYDRDDPTDIQFKAEVRGLAIVARSIGYDPS